MTSIRVTLFWAFAACLAAAGARAGEPGTSETQPFVHRLQIERDGRSVQAAAILVRREAREQDAVLHFVTAGHLFKSDAGQLLPYARTLTVHVGAAALAVRPEDVRLPVGGVADVAVFRVAAPATSVEAAPLSVTVPDVGREFFITGFTAAGRPAQSAQRVRRVATLAVHGDRAATFPDCAGAAAVAEGRVFGLVATCMPGAAPVVLPLAVIARWVERYVPGGLALPPAVLTEWQLTGRSINGPLLTVACGEEQTADVEVPFQLRAGELPVDAKADFLHQTSLRLAEVAVLRLVDRAVKLRFTIAGQQPPRFQPELPCGPGQALVTVRIDLISRRAR